MAIIKCKMCGGDLEIVAGVSVAECEYCGSKQTIPNADNEKKLTLFSRANRLRFGCEFDKAAGVYEAIVADFPQEAEAYWGLVLCKYGIEYVDDPATGRKIPTCHRSSFDSVMEDANLEQALENADVVARKVYREEAKAIEELRKGIIEVSGKEEPYDIFICYKETAEDGGRTIDSVIAQDVYDALTAKGYRVFFSRITLEDKLGQEYEPYIFAALNSAKIMLAFGTDYEYFNAVWVKNEWSRYLQLMTQDKSKHLIPCYKGIDAYDMPREFAKLQAQDMGKVGAIQDLLRGIEKLLPRQEKTTNVVQQVVTSGGPNVQALLQRGNMALEDGEWQKADGFFDQVLNMDAKCAEAYLGKALAAMKYRNLETCQRAHMPLNANRNVLQAGCADEAQVKRIVSTYVLPGYLKAERLEGLLNFDFSYESETADWSGKLSRCLDWFDGNRNLARAMQYADAGLRPKLEACRQAIKSGFVQALKQSQEDDRKNADEVMGRYHQKLTDGENAAKTLRAKAEAQRNADYQKALNLLEEGNPVEAMDLFQRTAQSNYLNSETKIQECVQLQVEQNEAAARERARIEAEARAEWERREATRRKEEAARKKKNRTIAIVVSTVAVVVIAVALILTQVVIPRNKYSAAQMLADGGDHAQAYEAFAAISSYEDSFQRAKEEARAAAEEYLAAGDEIQAMIYFTKAGDSIRAQQVYDIDPKIDVAWAASTGIGADGTLYYQSERDTIGSTENLDGISRIELLDEYDGIIGLTSNGSIVAEEAIYPYWDWDTFMSWTNMKQLEVDLFQVFGLTDQGTVKVLTDEDYQIDSDWKSWTNIVEIGNHWNSLWGLDSSGQVYFAPALKEGTYSVDYDVSAMRSVKKIAFWNGYMVAVTTDGTLIYTSNSRATSVDAFPFTITDNVEDIAASGSFLVVRYADGTVDVATSTQPGGTSYKPQKEAIRNVRKWTEIVNLYVVGSGIIGQDIHGNLHWQSLTVTYSETDGKTEYYLWDTDDVSDAMDKKQVVYMESSYKEYSGRRVMHILFVHEDGTVSSLNTGYYYTLEENSSGKYYDQGHFDGTYDQVDHWKLW